jgi:hypothetical protein
MITENRVILHASNLDEINSLRGKHFQYIMGSFFGPSTDLKLLSDEELIEEFQKMMRTSRFEIFWASCTVLENKSLFELWNNCENSIISLPPSGLVFIKAEIYENQYLVIQVLSPEKGHAIGLTSVDCTMLFLPYH